MVFPAVGLKLLQEQTRDNLLRLADVAIRSTEFCVLYRNVQRFRSGLVVKAHRLSYHSTLGLRVIKKKKKKKKEKKKKLADVALRSTEFCVPKKPPNARNPCSASLGLTDYAQVDMLWVSGTSPSTKGI